MCKKYVRVLLVSALLLLPVAVMGQSVSTGTITGMVRDTSGAVLPGVTVEAASPALIEKVRTAVTDSQGVYRIIDLRPGTYTVTFTLQGFSALRREGIALTTGFAATVDGELGVGNLEETITVSGAAPLVDTQSVSQQSVFSREVTENLPVGSSINLYGTLIPGVQFKGGAQGVDVGGSKGEFQQGFTIHGGRAADFQQLRDGMFFGTLVAAGNLMSSLNPAIVAETTVQTSSAGAEMESGGAVVNVVPRDGGNVFSATFNGNFSVPELQSDNLTDELQARGLTAAPTLRKRYDVGGGVGGPIREDKIWFFGSLRSWQSSTYYPGNYYNATPGTLFYTPDLSHPAYDDSDYQEARGRFTWQASSKDKITAMYGQEWNCDCAFTIPAGNTAPEATSGYATDPNWQSQFTWSRPATNRLLLEAGAVIVNGELHLRQFAGSPSDRGVLDTSRNYRYGALGYALALTGSLADQKFRQTNERFAVSYVTGSHSFKAGAQYLWGLRESHYYLDPAQQDQNFVFNGRTPTAVTYFASPLQDAARQTKIGLYVQDQWTVNRLTLNLGARFDVLNGRNPELNMPAGTWVPARSFPEVEDSPTWRDWSPRIGAAYDLFGDGRTAIKAAFGKFVLFESLQGIGGANSFSARLVNNATRAWSDANGDYIPQESELGPLSDSGFGQPRTSTTFSEEVLTDSRPYNWQSSVQLQQDLGGGFAVNVGYFRTSYENFRVINNRAVTAQDFTPYCVTAPTNTLLPDGGGNVICGFYDVAPGKFGQTNNLVELASNYGDQEEMFTGVDVAMTARLGGGRYLQAGLATGSTVTDTCYLNNLPNVTSAGTGTGPITGSAAGVITARSPEYCRVSTPWSGNTQFKLAVIYPTIWNLQLSANYQNVNGTATAATAAYANTAIVPSLGRDLAACGARTGAACTATVVADIVLPNVYYQEPRMQQLDVRVSRVFRLAGNATIQPQVDFFNVFNASPVLAINSRLGPSYNTPLNVLDPRLVKFGVNMTF